MKMMSLFLFFFFFNNTFSQEKKVIVTEISTEKMDADQIIGVDKFGFLYYTKDNVFFKRLRAQLFEYKNVALGKIEKIDIQNPLKIVLFYKNFNTIVTLDNQLNEIQKVNFFENAAQIVVDATGMASQNRFWIFNNLSQKIGLYDYLNNDYVELTQALQGNIKYYQTTFNDFQFIDEQLNWFNCTIFGKITNFGKVPDFDKMQMTDQNYLFFLKDNILFLKNLITQEIQIINHGDKTIESFFYNDKNLVIFTNQQIINYKIILP
jgi:hypothetical protein